MMNDQRGVIIELVESLAKADGVDPNEVDYTLHEYVDSDVLTKLAATEGSDWTFTFQVSGHEVKLTSGGQLFVDGKLYRENCLARP